MRNNWNWTAVGLFCFLATTTARAAVTQSVVNTYAAQGGFFTSVADPAAGFGYFVSTGASATLNKIKLSDLTPTGTIVLSTPIAAAAIDVVAGKAYFVGSSQTEYWLYKVDLAGFAVQVSTHLLQPLPSAVTGIVLDTSSVYGFLIFGSSPTSIIKTNLTDLGASATNYFSLKGFSNVNLVIRDTTPATTYAYLVSSTTPAMVAKVNLSSATPTYAVTAGSGTLGLGESPVHSIAMNPTTKDLFLGLGTSPGKIVRMNGNTLLETASIALGSGVNDLTSAIYDATSNFAYFGTNTSPAQIVQLNATNSQNAVALVLPATENAATCALDDGNGYMYVGLDTNPGMIVRLDLQGGPPTIVQQPSDLTARPGQTGSFNIIASGRITNYQWYKNGAAIPGATSNSLQYLNVSLDDNGSHFYCVVTTAQGTAQSRDAVLTIQPVVRVYPNPWRADRHTGVSVTFDHLAPGSKIKIFTLSSHWVKMVTPTGTVGTWDLTNDAGEHVASGYYLYAITTGTDDQTVAGKLAIIR